MKIFILTVLLPITVLLNCAGKGSQTVNAATEELLVSDDKEIKEIKEKDDESDPSDLDQDDDKQFEKLCSGEIVLPAHVQKKLKCRYVTRGISYLKIAPFKEEEAYLDPRIVVYHDVLYEEEIEVLKQLAKPELQVAEVRNFTTGAVQTGTERIAESAWIYNLGNKFKKVLRRRLKDMTGLVADTAEDLQVTHYDVGGFYVEHFDFVPDTDTEFFEIVGTGNRIATVLFYMNDVEQGGETVFTELNVTISPKKGSAVFWYNLKRNGSGDVLTYHAACPVLSGTKWIATSWLHEHGQEFIRPCTLLENE
ncbi:prolyl 4-hydroxylase subunit alpha-1-like [Belonocnema kinseyi]|uniref:prolyl 4-hydroxylase subunit alpha-1-like n=1 Tax=Belonocnema kinseyi TaxID=2817044 RepID=UPI00143DE732|nr:prolyl 4-hydroxylase subunit alpha-1-like [Belonocnema kinseyi]